MASGLCAISAYKPADGAVGWRCTVPLAERFDVTVLKIGQIRQQFLQRPVPPGNALEMCGDSRCKAHTQWPGRNTAHDAVGRDVFRHDCTRSQHRTITNGDARQHNYAVTYPHIVTDYHPIGATGGKEALIASGVGVVILVPD